MDQLFDSSLFNFLFGLLTFVLGNFFAYFLYRWQLQPMRLSWDMKTINLISTFAEQIPELNVTYADQSIRSPSMSRILFWNAGLKAITPTDVSKGNPFRLSVGKNSKILSVRLLSQNNPSNLISIVECSPSETLISFDYLKHNDGAIIQVFHDGETPRLLGELKDGFVHKKSVEALDFLDAIVPLSVFWLWAKNPLRHKIKVIIFSLFALLSGYLWSFFIFATSQNQGALLGFFIKARIAIIFVVYVYLLLLLWKTPSVPRGRDKFYEKIQ